MARIFAYLFGSAGILILLTLLLPHDPAREELPMILVAAIALAAAVGFVALFDRVPLGVFRLAPAFGSILIAVLAYSAGPTAAAAYLFLLIWVSLSASYFFPQREALGQVLFAIACVGAVFLLRDGIPLTGLLAAMVAGTLIVNGVVIVGLRLQSQRLVEHHDRAARTDFLTGLANRREFNERFAYELARAQRGGHPLSVSIFDLDAFKRVNDEYGHEAGDRALVAFAEILRRGTRRIDTAARIGGEEFALISPDTEAGDAAVVAERVRIGLEQQFASAHGLTVSCGVAGLQSPEETKSAIMTAADEALYQAKASGRNRVVVYGSAAGSGQQPSGGPLGPEFASEPV